MRSTIMVLNQEHTHIWNAFNIQVEYDEDESTFYYIRADVHSNGAEYHFTLGMYPTKEDAIFVLEDLVAFTNENPNGIYDMRQPPFVEVSG